MELLDLFKASENEKLKEEIVKLKAFLLPEQLEIHELSEKISTLTSQKLLIEKEICKLEKEIAAKKELVIQLDDDILFQDFSLYTPMYDFAKSEEYKERLNDIRKKQKEKEGFM